MVRKSQENTPETFEDKQLTNLGIDGNANNPTPLILAQPRQKNCKNLKRDRQQHLSYDNDQQNTILVEEEEEIITLCLVSGENLIDEEKKKRNWQEQDEDIAELNLSSEEKATLQNEIKCIWVRSRKSMYLSLFVLLFSLNMITGSILFKLHSQTTEISVQTCQIESHSASPCEINNKPSRNYGSVQVGDVVWFCGGHASKKDVKYDQKSCVLLNIFDIEMKRLEYKMNYPRVKPLMHMEGNKVFVIGGTTSDFRSKTGCRETQEVFDTCNQTAGWIVEDIGENDSCHIY